MFGSVSLELLCYSKSHLKLLFCAQTVTAVPLEAGSVGPMQRLRISSLK